MKLITLTLSSLWIMLTMLPETSFSTVRSKIKKGNKFFYDKKYDEAITQYRDAQIKAPESEIIHYNLGNTLYKQENYENALSEYSRGLKSKDKNIKSKIYYNIGNAEYQKENYDKALENYKKCLNLNPSDEDAKYNIQFILQKVLQQQKQQAKSKQQKEQETQQKQQEEQKKAKEQKKKYMSKEDVERLLQMAQEQEKEAQKKKQKAVLPKLPPVEEDW